MAKRKYHRLEENAMVAILKDVGLRYGRGEHGFSRARKGAWREAKAGAAMGM